MIGLREDLTGKIFGRLIVICRAANKSGRVAWLCKCTCGKEKITTAKLLKRGKSKSCGCLSIDTLKARKTDDVARFWDNVDQKSEDECWDWKASCHKYGYGHFYYKSKQIAAHRASWMINCGEIPKGLLVLHECDNPKCVNPNHLFLGTDKDNAQDRKAKGRNGIMHQFGNKRIPARGGSFAPNKFIGFKKRLIGDSNASRTR